MSFPFNASRGLILVQTTIVGPSGRAVSWLALDTGATDTVIAESVLVAAGFDLAQASQRVPVTMASGVEFVPVISLSKITALGQDRVSFPALCHTLPASAGVDGILGLDFFRGHILTLDFQTGQIVLS